MFCLPKSALLKTVYSRLSRTFTHTSQWRLFRTPSVILSVAYSSSSYQCNNEVAAGSSKNINMNMLPDVSSVAGGSTGFTIPEEAYLKGWELVNKRATNMVYTVFGEKPMTKMLQIGGSTSFIDALGKSTKFDISVCTHCPEEATALSARKQFSSVDVLPSTVGTTESAAVVELPYRLASFEMIAYLQHPKVGSAAVDPEVPLSHLADLLIGRGCCIIGGRAQVWKRQRLLQQLESLSEAGVADMLSLQTIPCGHDELPFNEYPDKAEFKEQSVMEAEHGSEVDDLDDIIVEDPVTKPYYIALMRRR